MGRVLVAGSINMDVVATATRHPKVGETVAGHAVHFFPGGKGANQAVAAAKLGASTALIGRLGVDPFGQQLRSFLAAQGVDLALVKDTTGADSGTAIITIANADNSIVVVPGANARVSVDDVAAPLLVKGDVAVSQFEIPLPTVGAFFERARAAGATTILNPAPAIACSPALLDLADILILNETELGFFTHTELHDSDATDRFVEAARRLQTGANGIICVTLGRRGVLALVGGEALMIAGRAVKAVDTTGAGDCFVGALAAQGVDLALVKDTTGADSGTAIITIANADNSIVVVPGANARVSVDDVAAPVLAKGDVTVSQFEIPQATIAAFFKRARAAGATTILNPAPAIACSPALLDLVDILILNETELAFFTHTELHDSDAPDRFVEAARRLQTGANGIICVTLGRRGVLALVGGEALMIAGRAVKAVDTTGAGDCFVGALAAQLAGGATIRDALNYANAAASICVQRMGAAPSMPTAAEVDEILARRA